LIVRLSINLESDSPGKHSYYGTLIIVAGGEVGTLQKWWNYAEQQQWRWNMEFYNHR
jgi:hypothetical protein